MEKLDLDKLNNVAGGKREVNKICNQFAHEKYICDDCGKLLDEKISFLTDPGVFSQNGYAFDYGCFCEGESKPNLCKDCYEKRRENKYNGT